MSPQTSLNLGEEGGGGEGEGEGGGEEEGEELWNERHKTGRER